MHLGNLDARRDWGFAGDFVEAIWRVLQHPEPGHFVVATGEAHSVRDFCAEAFGHAGLYYQDHVVIDPRYFHPVEVDYLPGNRTKTRDTLGWQPRTSFGELVRMMVDADRAYLCSVIASP